MKILRVYIPQLTFSLVLCMAGVSRKAQKLFLLVFLSRYLDLFTSFYSSYNSAMKIFFVVSTAAILYGLHYVEPAKSTYSVSQDRFVYWHALVPAGTVAFLVHSFGTGTVEISGGGMEMHFSGHIHVIELLWTFSICLEPMAMLPQLAIFHRNRNLNTELRIAIGCMGVYRFLYILNWVYRAHTEPRYRHHVLVYTAGVLQALFYSDFFYHQSRYVL
jgi:ER lumen protein retaining receptor